MNYCSFLRWIIWSKFACREHQVAGQSKIHHGQKTYLSRNTRFYLICFRQMWRAKQVKCFWFPAREIFSPQTFIRLKQLGNTREKFQIEISSTHSRKLLFFTLRLFFVSKMNKKHKLLNWRRQFFQSHFVPFQNEIRKKQSSAKRWLVISIDQFNWHEWAVWDDSMRWTAASGYSSPKHPLWGNRTLPRGQR